MAGGHGQGRAPRRLWTGLNASGCDSYPRQQPVGVNHSGLERRSQHVRTGEGKDARLRGRSCGECGNYTLCGPQMDCHDSANPAATSRLQLKQFCELDERQAYEAHFGVFGRPFYKVISAQFA